jgi:hypothetical protein
MLTEFKRLRQDRTGYRRLFENEGYNLYVWYDRKGGAITGFQLVYFLGDEQKALTWTSDGGYSHNTVDGWDSVRFNKTPLLVMDGDFARYRILGELESDLLAMEPAIGRLVLEKIQDCPI